MADKPKHQGPDWGRVLAASPQGMSELLALRAESGSVALDNRLVSFLYQLMHDHVTPGVVEGIVSADAKYVGETITYTNGWLARYAEHLAKRLTAPAEEPAAR